jgi:hypothetical protein
MIETKSVFGHKARPNASPFNLAKSGCCRYNPHNQKDAAGCMNAVQFNPILSISPQAGLAAIIMETEWLYGS